MAVSTTNRSGPRVAVAVRVRVVALVAICLAELLVVLDNTLVNVALPSMAVQLQARMSGLQWIVDAFTLAFSGLLLALGHLGDRFGRRRVMIVGLAGVAVMSGAGALSTTLGQVIAARAGMGVFAAAVFPATLALIINLFPEARGRAAAIALWTAMAGIAVAIGPITGGWLLEYFSWHSVFWINVPIAVIAIAAVLFVVPESRAEHTGRLDLVGIALSLVAVTTLVWTIIDAPRQGWLAPRSIAGYAIALVLLVVYVLWELRVDSPVLNVRLFGIRRFSVPALAITVSYFCAFGFLFLITQYFQGVKEYSALEFGIHSLPFAAAVGLGAPIATLVAQRVGTTATVITGLLVLAAGMYIAGQVKVETPYLGPVVVSMVLLGIGFGVVQGPATESIMGSVPLAQAGAGSAVNDTTREVGGTLGVAVLGSIMTSVYTARVGGRIDAIPAAIMNPDQKSIARDSPISVLEIVKTPVSPFLAGPKADLIHAMKAAALEGAQSASYVAVGALLACVVAVATLLPWRPQRGRSVLLGWRTENAEG
ncbi:MFS transporter [Nocardia terpenica]|uniref:MFS transporter n=1 Tax=Nocardia terpenica TaxID=455432 RepID=A0A164HY40_9NOCA|nr:MFS transporter [Nocardia terpenica]KZM68921.1 MFS transporter [Nocardia terpenica]MBF6062252.1 MFS transporter [Nocardia terpenica]MBF6104340.1 MFS transporter [Nocardia terpenica]MBF6109804.1 MFS transporter [Nocardia terpenica]MBF6120110.1 MFS transporter [Nocardia terpenica]